MTYKRIETLRMCGKLQEAATVICRAAALHDSSTNGPRKKLGTSNDCRYSLIAALVKDRIRFDILRQIKEIPSAS